MCGDCGFTDCVYDIDVCTRQWHMCVYCVVTVKVYVVTDVRVVKVSV